MSESGSDMEEEEYQPHKLSIKQAEFLKELLEDTPIEDSSIRKVINICKKYVIIHSKYKQSLVKERRKYVRQTFQR